MLRKKFIWLALPLLMLVASVQPAFAQKKKSNKKKKEETSFVDHLWYGGGVNLGFSSFNGSSSFGFGVAPMVGYKFNKVLSAGPRISEFFVSQKYPGAKAVSLFDTELGVFVRGHIFRGFFIQGDLSNEWVQAPNDIVGNKITKVTYQRFNQYLGIGYNFGRGEGGAGSEISLHYNFAIANDIYSTEQPIDYRFGFTWHF